MSISNDPSCIWCGTFGSPANYVILYVDGETALAECEWCAGHEYFRRKASNGKRLELHAEAKLF
jgi:hypothetical protein